MSGTVLGPDTSSLLMGMCFLECFVLLNKSSETPLLVGGSCHSGCILLLRTCCLQGTVGGGGRRKGGMALALQVLTEVISDGAYQLLSQSLVLQTFKNDILALGSVNSKTETLQNV